MRSIWVCRRIILPIDDYPSDGEYPVNSTLIWRSHVVWSICQRAREFIFPVESAVESGQPDFTYWRLPSDGEYPVKFGGPTSYEAYVKGLVNSFIQLSLPLNQGNLILHIDDYPSDGEYPIIIGGPTSYEAYVKGLCDSIDF